MSRPAEDICAYCFTFANRHRYLARHETQSFGGDDGLSASNGDDKTIRDINSLLATIDIDEADSAATVAAEAREMLLLDSAEHVKMARVQRLLYQQMVALGR